MHLRRNLPGESCPCGRKRAQMGEKWVSHTNQCPSWLEKYGRLFQSPRATNVSNESEVDHANLNTKQHQHEDISKEDDISNELLVPQRPQSAVLDIIPTGPEPLLPTPDAPPDSLSTTEISPQLRLSLWHSTNPNTFGLNRRYQLFGSQSIQILVPDLNVSLDDLLLPSADITTLIKLPTPQEIVLPFPNTSTFRLAHWFFTGGPQKSLSERKRLVEAVILAPDFSPDHFRGKNLLALDHAIDQLDIRSSEPLSEADAMVGSSSGWKKQDICISIPQRRDSRRKRHTPPPDSDSFDNYGRILMLPGLYTRSLTEIIRLRFMDITKSNCGVFHFTPYQQWWHPGSNQPAQRVYDDLYTGDEWIKEHAALQRSPPVPGCTLERCIAALMIWSDSTHLAQTGQSSIWPVYLYLGNQSKSARRKPLTRSSEHVALLPKVTGPIKACIESALDGKPISDDMMAHVRREMFHACWNVLLDDEFVCAYREGLKILCFDGIERRIYPRIFTYSADYPEKVKLACIRQHGTFSSPQTMVEVKDIHQLGTVQDRRRRERNPRTQDGAYLDNILEARRMIYFEGRPFDNPQVARLLDPTSSVPTINAFRSRLGTSFDPLRMLVPDILHEFELGVWKNLLIHLMRLLEKRGASAVSLFNSRFRQISSYPPDTIRKFSFDVSAMTKFAARDYEDVLQCCIPCFEGLFTPEQYTRISVLIFTLARWHALAKLRMHTESTLDALDWQTTLVGLRLRRFQDSQAKLFPSVVETEAEFEARKRRTTRAALARGVLPPETFEKQPRLYSLSTYKLHALGDYVRAIKLFGTSDSYSTQIGELEHRRAKARARRTNQINIEQGIATLDRREAHLNTRAKALDTALGTSVQPLQPNVQVPSLDRDSELQEGIPLDEHHHIGVRGTTVRFIDFFASHKNDPAVQASHACIAIAHLLGRLTAVADSITHMLYTDTELNTVSFATGSMTQHAVFRVNYTSYDVRRAQDVLNPRFKHHFVMMTNPEDNADHPYWYAKILGIYHVNVLWQGSTFARASRRMEFLWVRWMELVQYGSWNQCSLDRVAYATGESYRDAFGFVDPASVIRSAHLIPAFNFGRSENEAGHRIALDDPKDGDWNSYYVNRFVDRDMFMRYMRGGVGHFGHPPESTVADFAGETETDAEQLTQPRAPENESDMDEMTDYDEATEEDLDI
ncbi:hypothetical protein BDV93DRAFT_611903 [Ceratobasidium sp. AG-I]|nr:hypothetical protein BDV93DRAFT_611903 [Ceratobasidium sp. AG-I]